MHLEDWATGEPAERLNIGGRLHEGQSRSFILLEEPDEPVQVHYNGKTLVPHLVTRECPNCQYDREKPMWYLGAYDQELRRLCILELTKKCFDTAGLAASKVGTEKPPEILRPDTLEQLALMRAAMKAKDDAAFAAVAEQVKKDMDTGIEASRPMLSIGKAAPVFRGLMVEITRAKIRNSPRVLRCQQRVKTLDIDWRYHTRLELAKCWRIAITPKAKLGVFRGQESS